MSQFTPQVVQQAMQTTGMVPVFFNADIEIAKSVLTSSYEGGVRTFEFTNRGANAFDVFTKLIDFANSNYPDLILGIGTILDGETTRRFIKAGAHFIVSPVLKQEMSAICREHGKLWVPGCATLTEIVTAKDLGAEVIKIFPGSVLGPGFVSAILPVVPGLKLMPTGGVEPTEQNLTAWFKAGVMCVGMGSQLFTAEILSSKNWPLLTDKVRDSLALIKKIRSPK